MRYFNEKFLTKNQRNSRRQGEWRKSKSTGEHTWKLHKKPSHSRLKNKCFLLLTRVTASNLKGLCPRGFSLLAPYSSLFSLLTYASEVLIVYVKSLVIPTCRRETFSIVYHQHGRSSPNVVCQPSRHNVKREIYSQFISQSPTRRCFT